MPADPIALVIIRAWDEPGSPRPLRAQLRLTTDVAGGLRPPVYLTEADSATLAVRAWLGSVQSRADGEEPDAHFAV